MQNGRWRSRLRIVMTGKGSNHVRTITLFAVLTLGACAGPPSRTTSVSTRPKPTNPVDAFYLRCQDAIEPFWRRQSKESADMLGLGTAVLVFEIPRAGGHARGVKVVSNNGPEALAEIAVASVAKVVFPSIPNDVVAVTNYRPFWVEYSFTVHP